MVIKVNRLKGESGSSGKKASSGQRGPRYYIKRLWIVFFSTLAFITLLFFLISIGALGYMPSFEDLENPKSLLASEVWSADSVLLGTYYIENRSNVRYRELPPHLVNALLATEDVRFTKHVGVDVRGLFRAVAFLGTKGGASTITQQLAKMLFPREKNQFRLKIFFIKLKEWVTAIKLEKRYTKEEIIAMYFNKFDFLYNAVGIKSAARIYFDTRPEELNIQQAATLVAMAKNPSLYNPVRRPDVTLVRRNVVLHQMLRYDYLSRAEYDSLKAIPLGLNFQSESEYAGPATYFREYLRNYLDEWCKTHYKADGKPYNLYKDGLKIYTTIDSRMQRYAEEAVAEYLGKELQPSFFRHWKGKENAPFYFQNNAGEEIEALMTQAMHRSDRYIRLKEAGCPGDSIELIFDTPVKMKVFSWRGEIDTVMTPMDSIRYNKFFLQAGLMSVESSSGYVKAYVGGIDYKYFKYDHVVLSRRQVGSTFKPFIYTLAMQEGLSPCTKMANIQPVIELEDGRTWAPRNSDNDRAGQEITLRYALATSNNWISGHLIKRFPPLSVVKIAQKMGVTSPIDPVPSIVLGSADLSLYEMVGAMNTFANKGIYVKPVMIARIEDKHGNILETFVPDMHEAMSEETAYLMLDLMKGVVQYGTGGRLRYKYAINYPVAGKTGTTNNQSDGWFMGITRDLTSGIWVGCEDRAAHFRSLQLGQGANMALPIWALYMQKVYADSTLRVSQADFEPPAKPLSVEIDCAEYEAEFEKMSTDYIDDF